LGIDLGHSFGGAVTPEHSGVALDRRACSVALLQDARTFKRKCCQRFDIRKERRLDDGARRIGESRSIEDFLQ
jgi:hypothetical protein